MVVRAWLKESWALKNWCFWTVLLEKTLESPLGCKEIQPVHPKGDQSWVFFGRTDAEAETPILWPPDVKSWLIWKDPDAGKGWSGEEKGMTEDEMVGWHHWLDGHEFEETLGVGDGQGGLACCSPWGHKELDRMEWLNWTAVFWIGTYPLALLVLRSSDSDRNYTIGFPGSPCYQLHILELIRLYNCVSQFLVINLFVSIYPVLFLWRTTKWDHTVLWVCVGMRVTVLFHLA